MRKVIRYALVGSVAALMAGSASLEALSQKKPVPKPQKPPAGKAPAAASSSALIAQGQKVYAANGCNACHAIGGKGGAVGPALDSVGKFRQPGWIQVHVATPQKHTPGSTMPPYGDRIKGREMAALVAYLSSLKGAPAPSAPKAAVPKADPAVIAALEKAGGSVRELAQNDSRLVIAFNLAGPSVTDAAVAPLAKLPNNVYELNLARTGITDAALAHLKPLTALQVLHLENTRISDAGLLHLKGLTKLEYLNLYGTQVTDAGLDQLAGLKSLKNLYVWQTKVTKGGAEKLKQSLPQCTVEMGWEAPPAESKPGS